MKEHVCGKEGSNHLCERCMRELSYSNEVLSERQNLWISAYNLLSAREWKAEGDPTPMDVQQLAEFLAGENS